MYEGKEKDQFENLHFDTSAKYLCVRVSNTFFLIDAQKNWDFELRINTLLQITKDAN